MAACKAQLEHSSSQHLSVTFACSGAQAAVLGFVGSPWTLATYIIEGSSSGLYKTIKTMIHGNPDLLSALLAHLADQIATYSCYQIQSGAQCIQLFDSWGGQLPPQVRNYYHSNLLLLLKEVEGL